MEKLRDSVTLIYAQQHGLTVLLNNLQAICKHPKTVVVEVTGLQRYYAHQCVDCDFITDKLVSEDEIKDFVMQREMDIQMAIIKQADMAKKKKTEGGSI